MRLAVSNIAWPAEHEGEIAGWLPRLGVNGVEVAPTKVWPHPLDVTEAEARGYRHFWESRGLPVVAMQSLLFEMPHLRLFEDERQRKETAAYLAGIIRLAGWLGARVLVFGSPKNRARGQLGVAEADAVAVPFFRELGRIAADHGLALCIEPNPPAYGCDYVTKATEGIALVRAVNHPGFGLHLDAAGMTLSEDVPEETFRAAQPVWRHFHVSEPFLGPIGQGGVDHRRLAAALRAAGYTNWVSIEMKVPESGFKLERLVRALALVRAEY